MTHEQTYLVRKSFAEIERHHEVAALVFYKRLFELDPGLRPMFKHDIVLQSAKLIDMLATLISMIERPGDLMSELRLMGARHKSYGVKDEHYPLVGQALLAMVRETVADAYTPEMEEAWKALYAVVSGTMLEGAAEAAL
ncbi:MAG: hypothetical protein RL693_1711 [Verrucomicrobiota bacterium]